MYNKLPIIEYDNKPIRDISLMVDVVDKAKNVASAWDTYNIEDEETPESLAYDFYGSTKYNFLIFQSNDIVDPFYQWPLSQFELLSLTTSVYGAGNEYSTHHWEVDGHVVQSGTLNAVAVSNYDFEESKNEEKRKIRILDPKWLNLVDRNIQDIL